MIPIIDHCIVAVLNAKFTTYCLGSYTNNTGINKQGFLCRSKERFLIFYSFKLVNKFRRHFLHYLVVKGQKKKFSTITESANKTHSCQHTDDMYLWSVPALQTRKFSTTSFRFSDCYNNLLLLTIIYRCPIASKCTNYFVKSSALLITERLFFANYFL